MKKVFCPKCDTSIVITETRMQALRGGESLSILCPECGHQLRIRIRLASKREYKQERQSLGHLIVVENVFGYKQYFSLGMGVNRIGRRNKDTETDLPIITGDPSMDRHHALLRVSLDKNNRLVYALADDDSRVGTFVGGRLLAPKEWCVLNEGDVFTLGATTLIFSTEPLGEDQEGILDAIR